MINAEEPDKYQEENKNQKIQSNMLPGYIKELPIYNESKIKFALIDFKYKLMEKIFKNSSNKIKIALNINTNSQCAIKLITSKYANINIIMLEKEAYYYSKVNHENILKCLGQNMNAQIIKKKYMYPKSCHYIALEYASKGEMYDYVKLNQGLYWKIALYYFKQLISGIEYLHSQNICHRDIKVDNLLLDENFNLKISDLEFCQDIKNKEGEYIFHSDKLGTISYMAPEFFSNRFFKISEESSKCVHHGDKVDIFSCGVVLFVLLAGSFPFNSAEKMDNNYRLFFDNKPEVFWNKKLKNKHLTTKIPDLAKDLINNMIEVDPNKRITMNKIKEHPFLNYKCNTPSNNEVSDYMKNIWLMIQKNKKKDDC